MPLCSFSVRCDLSVDQFENLCIEIRKTNSLPFLVATWYRPLGLLINTFSYFKS